MLINGTKIEFDNKGNWTSIDCKKREVPTDLLNKTVKRHVTNNRKVFPTFRLFFLTLFCNFVPADGYCTKYTTTLTLPDKNWAQVFYDTYEEQMWDFEQQFGQRPDLKLDGNKMILDAVIAGEVSREQIEQTIYSLDWINNRPLIFSLF